MKSFAHIKRLIVLMLGLAFAAVSAAGQTTLSNANLTAFIDALAAGGTVTLDFDGTITVTNRLSITNSVTLDGSGHSVTISGGGTSEIFAVATNTTLLLQTLTIADGLSTNGSPGAIANAGALTAYDCVFSNNISRPPPTVFTANSPTGAIVNSGLLLLSNSSFIKNSAIGINLGPRVNAPFGVGDTVFACCGGAIYNAGDATLTECTFNGNSAIGGDGYLKNNTSVAGGDGEGGAIFNSGAITMSNSTFVNNLCKGGVGGDGMLGDGIQSSGPGAPGGNGLGGAICSVGGSIVIVNSTFLANSTGGGTGGTGGDGNGFANIDGDGGPGGTGGNSLGGAVYLSKGLLSLTNVTCAVNSLAIGLGGAGGPARSQKYANGANGSVGLVLGASAGNSGGTLSAKNSIFFVQSRVNFYGSVTDLGYNIASGQNSSLTNATSRNGVNPMLGAFGYYGGNTRTIPLLFSSPAINGGDPSAFPPVDQRGRPRPSGPAPDIGAFEYTFPTFGGLSVSDSGAQFVLLGEPGDSSVIDASSNLVDWTTLTTNSFGVTNAIKISDTTARAPGGHYYRARLQ